MATGARYIAPKMHRLRGKGLKPSLIVKVKGFSQLNVDHFLKILKGAGSLRSKE